MHDNNNNWFMSNSISPTLTLIDQPRYMIGKTTFGQLYVEIKPETIAFI